MKKKTLTAALLSAVLLSALAGASLDKCSAVNRSVSVDVSSPENDGFYDSTNVTLKFTVLVSIDLPIGCTLYSVQYRVDNDVYKHVVLRVSQSITQGFHGFSYDLIGLSEGRHLLEVTATGSAGGALARTVSSGIIYFTVDTSGPKVRFVSSQQQTFSSGADASFNFTVFEGVSWLGYSIDGGSVVTVTDNVTVSHRLYKLTLPDLSDGSHSLTVYAEDLAGNMGESEPLQFTVGQETQPEPEQPASEQPFPTALIAAASASVAAVAILAGILLYIKRNKRKLNQPQSK